MQIEVSSHNWSSLSAYLSKKRAWTNELSLPSFLSNDDVNINIETFNNHNTILKVRATS